MKNEIPTFSEILQNPIIEAYEDDDFYYIRPKPQFCYDLTMYKVDKKTKGVNLLLYTKFFSIEPSTRKINPKFLKKSDYLAHHGRRYQKWGVENGPPYPLYRQEEFGKAGAYEKKMTGRGTRKDKTSKSKRQRDTKTTYGVATEVGIASAAFMVGTAAASNLIKSVAFKHAAKKWNERQITEAREKVNRVIKTLDNPVQNGFHTLSKPETLEEAVKNTNPWKDSLAGMMNCANCSTASCLRRKGYDVVASPTAVGRKDLDEITKSIKNRKDCVSVVDGKTVGRSEESAANLIKSKFNTTDGYGLISVRFPGGAGHVFNWDMKNGKVRFYDTQLGDINTDTSEYFKRNVVDNRKAWVIRMDNAEFNYNKLRKYKVVE